MVGGGDEVERAKVERVEVLGREVLGREVLGRDVLGREVLVEEKQRKKYVWFRHSGWSRIHSGGS